MVPEWRTRCRGVGRRLGLSALLAIVLGLASVPAAFAAERDTRPGSWQPPKLVQTSAAGGSGAVYFWGLAYNPVTQDLWVGDYFHSRVRRLTVEGARLPDAEYRQLRNASVAAVDSRTGAVYMASQGSVIAHYDKTGKFVKSWNMGLATTFMVVDHTGNLWGVSRHQDTGRRIQLRQWNTSNGATIKTVNVDLSAHGVTGSTTSLGLDIDSDGHLWMTESVTGKVVEADQSGKVLRVWGQPGSGPGLLGGDLRGLEVDDAKGWVYVGDAARDEIEKFDLNGKPLLTFGGTGSEVGQLRAPRQISLDKVGNLWVAEYGNKRAQLFSPAGTSLRVIPQPAWTAPAPHLASPDDVTVDPLNGNVWIADQYEHRIVVLDKDGRLLATRGTRGGTSAEGMNYPRAIAFDAEHRQVWVGQHEAGSISVFDADTFAHVSSITDPNPRHNFRLLFSVTDLDIAGTEVYATLQKTGDIVVLDKKSGVLLRKHACCGGGQTKNAIGIHPTTGRIYVGNKKDGRIDVYSPSWQFQFSFGSMGSGAGQFKEPFEIAFAGDEVWVADTVRSNLQAFTSEGTYLGAVGTGYGSGANQFRGPKSLAVHGSLLYVTDTDNGRIVVYDTAESRGPSDGRTPSLTVTGPASATSTSQGNFRVTGSAADADGIVNVDVQVQDTATGRWWNGLTGTWQDASFANQAPLVSSGRPATSVTFEYAFSASEIGRTYAVSIRSRDAFNWLSPVTTRTITLTS